MLTRLIPDFVKSALNRKIDWRIKQANPTLMRRSVPPWWITNAAEPSVGLVIRDFVRPGDITFDVGGFEGSLTQIMSRLVGPMGLVCTFEANPGILKQLTTNIIENCLSNVLLLNKAVHERSGEFVFLDIPPHSPAAGRIVERRQNARLTDGIETIALDDFVETAGIVPSFVKMDIEGAEAFALIGFERTLRRVKPHLVLEHTVGDDQALKLVRGLGYRAFCTNQYDEIDTSNDFLPGTAIRNIICIHSERFSESPFRGLSKKVFVQSVSGNKFRHHISERESVWTLSLELSEGRYVLVLYLAAQQSRDLFSEVVVDGRVVGKYYADAATFLKNCRDMPLEVRGASTLEYRIGEAAFAGALSISIDRLDIHRVESIDSTEWSPFGP